MTTLAIETSCDETAVAIVDSRNDHHRILADIVSSQVKIHAKYGGVVPNLASREHLKNITPCLKVAFQKAGVSKERIELIAVTIGPGLIPALLIGTNTAKALSFAWNKPIVGINHIEAHIYANWLTRQLASRGEAMAWPALCLVVSGGHTQLILMRGHGKYKLLGETRDDAVGECFDKVAKFLNLGYPGGPIIERKAKHGNPHIFDLPRPMINTKNYDFSFSGLKTAVLYLVKNLRDSSLKAAIPGVATFTSRSNRRIIPNLCASFQQAVIDVLLAKTIRAAKEYKVKTVMLAGGVAANKELRKQFKKALVRHRVSNGRHSVSNKLKFLVPPKIFCTDNAVMIAVCAHYHVLRSQTGSWRDIEADANLRIV